MNFIQPQWPAPAHVKAVFTTRIGGFSQGSFSGFNLGDHVGDDLIRVHHNRMLLKAHLQLPSTPIWLEQVHGTEIIIAQDQYQKQRPRADAAITDVTNRVLAVLTADCLPVLITDIQGQQIAAVHAGWRGLAGGILKQVVQQFKVGAEKLLVCFGPAIGPQAFEVGLDLKTVFTRQDQAYHAAFKLKRENWYADLYQLAKIQLNQAGIRQIFTKRYCTFSQQKWFYSYRREGQTGRMASLIWRVH